MKMLLKVTIVRLVTVLAATVIMLLLVLISVDGTVMMTVDKVVVSVVITVIDVDSVLGRAQITPSFSSHPARLGPTDSWVSAGGAAVTVATAHGA